MTDYTSITNASVQPEAPVTSELVTALRDNPIAIAEGSTGAPTNETAWHFIEAINDSTDTTTLTFSATLVGDGTAPTYRKLRVCGGTNCSTSGPPTLRVQLELNSVWTTVIEFTAGTGNYFDLTIDNVDNDNGTPEKFASGFYSNTLGANWRSAAATSFTPTAVANFTTDIYAATGVRVSMSGSQNFLGSTGDPTRIFLEGVKRTLP